MRILMKFQHLKLKFNPRDLQRVSFPFFKYLKKKEGNHFFFPARRFNYCPEKLFNLESWRKIKNMLPLRSKRKAIRDGGDILVETVDKYSRSLGLSLRRASLSTGQTSIPDLCAKITKSNQKRRDKWSYASPGGDTTPKGISIRRVAASHLIIPS